MPRRTSDRRQRLLDFLDGVDWRNIDSTPMRAGRYLRSWHIDPEPLVGLYVGGRSHSEVAGAITSVLLSSRDLDPEREYDAVTKDDVTKVVGFYGLPLSEPKANTVAASLKRPLHEVVIPRRRNPTCLEFDELMPLFRWGYRQLRSGATREELGSRVRLLDMPSELVVHCLQNEELPRIFERDFVGEGLREDPADPKTRAFPSADEQKAEWLRSLIALPERATRSDMRRFAEELARHREDLDQAFQSAIWDYRDDLIQAVWLLLTPAPELQARVRRTLNRGRNSVTNRLQRVAWYSIPKRERVWLSRDLAESWSDFIVIATDRLRRGSSQFDDPLIIEAVSRCQVEIDRLRKLLMGRGQDAA